MDKIRLMPSLIENGFAEVWLKASRIGNGATVVRLMPSQIGNGGTAVWLMPSQIGNGATEVRARGSHVQNGFTKVLAEASRGHDRAAGSAVEAAAPQKPLESFPTFVPVDQHDSPHLSKQMGGAYTVANRPFSFLKDAHSNNLRKKQSGGKRND